jgi:transposase
LYLFSITYDNLSEPSPIQFPNRKAARTAALPLSAPEPVARVQQDANLQLAPVVSHYLFADRFGRPGKGNDKGKVEGLVKYARTS